MVKVITLPKHFNVSSIIDVLADFDFLFKITDEPIEHLHFETKKVEKPSMIGALLLYKIIEYTVIHKCIKKGTIPYTSNPKLLEFLVRYGFHNLIYAYITDKDSKISKVFKKLQIFVNEKFIVAPTALLREDLSSREAINKAYLPTIKNYYSSNPKATSMILLAFCEIILNFWEHAKQDTQSIIVANGNHEVVEIACADNGEGIVSTLLPFYPDKVNNPDYIISKSVEKGKTSKKKTNHMGYGLWILDEITSKTGGRMHIYSQGGYYMNQGGKKNQGKCGYWQGTIVYLSLPLRQAVTLEDIVETNNNLKINWA